MELLEQIAWSAPAFVVFVLIPAFIRASADKLLGIDYYLRASSFEEGFRSFVHTGLFYPLFEELLFRGLPLLLLGSTGMWFATAIWVLMHPAWQLNYLSHAPLSKKLLATATSLVYYVPSGYFYGSLWLGGAGTAALFWHTALNAVITLAEQLREVNLELRELPRKLAKPREWSWRGIRLQPEERRFVRGRGGDAVEGEPEEVKFVRKVERGEGEAIWRGEQSQLHFVRKRALSGGGRK
ncbi:MAG: hypothetical protein QXZ31_05795 [Thermofilaceae archaeon]